MQNVWYINPKFKELVISNNPPFLLEKISGIGHEDAQLMTSDPAELDGTSFNGLYFGPREITVTMHIKGNTRAQMYENKMKLQALLNPALNRDGALGRLEYTNDYGSWWIPAVVKRGPQGLNRVANYFKSEQIVFYCPNPYFRGFTYNRAKMAYLGGGLRFPVRFGAVRFGAHSYKASIYNFGDSPSHLELDIIGPAVRPEIVKLSTGEFIRLRQEKELFEGDILHIDTTPGKPRVTIQRADGEVEDAIGYIDLSSQFFLLEPGENQQQYLSADDSQTTIIIMATLPWFGGL
ncbi:MAG: phage distal tail protein [Burkholderiales bacterium]